MWGGAGCSRMRLRVVLLTLVLLSALAGCFGGDDNDTPPTVTTPVATSPEPTVTTPVATPATTPEVTPAPTPAAPLPPKVIYEKVFEFTQGDATGQSPKVETSQAVPEGYANVTVNLTLERASTAPTTLPVSGTVNSPMVRILDANATEVVAEGEEGAAVNATFPSTQGAWTIRFEGAGTLKATVKLTAIP